LKNIAVQLAGSFQRGKTNLGQYSVDYVLEHDAKAFAKSAKERQPHSTQRQTPAQAYTEDIEESQGQAEQVH